jgi:hypothetical protein
MSTKRRDYSPQFKNVEGQFSLARKIFTMLSVTGEKIRRSDNLVYKFNYLGT